MGVSITRIVKFIRKGKGVIVAQSRNVYNYTYKEWTQFYGLSGRSVNWDGIINVSDFPWATRWLLMARYQTKKYYHQSLR